ncbi:hypothetical protein Mapa_003128 [Marchantia paleacea]|nr:hypothetical protein Mapa_003128 [Marchantia paleacea]
MDSTCGSRVSMSLSPLESQLLEDFCRLRSGLLRRGAAGPTLPLSGLLRRYQV